MRGLTQQQLGDRIGTHKGNIANWENHRRQMSMGVQIALADALGIEVYDLFRDPNQPSIDQLLASSSPAVKTQAFEIVKALLKTGTR